MPKTSKRLRQVADMIQRELSKALRLEIKDPRLIDVAITDVVVTPDLRIAKIYFSLIKDEQLATVETALRNASGHFRHIIAKTLELRYTPTLNFYYDQTIAEAEKLSRLLNRATESKIDDSAKEE